jgi:O-antigen ligase
MRHKSYIPIKESTVNFLILSCTLITLYFNTKFEDPFNVPKQIVLLLSSAWISGHVVSAIRYRRPKIVFKQYILFILVSLFIGGMLTASLLTDVKIVAFLGETQRRNGFLTYLSLTVIFLFTVFAINFSNVLKIFKSIILLNLLLGTYGLLQISGRDPYEWNNPYNSMFSTLGNPNFASSLLAVFASISFFSCFVKKLKSPWKFTATINIFVSLFAIFQSESRQGVLVFLLSLLFFSVVLIFKMNVNLGKISLASSLVLIIFAIFGMLQKGPLTSILYKDSVSVRGYYWRAAIEMFRSNPWHGIGVDRYGEYFKEYREFAYPLKYGFEITSNNAHNVFLQFFATSGAIVGLSYLLLVVYIVFIGVQGIRETSSAEQLIVLALLSSYIGFQAQSLISIDNIGISIWGWLLGGALVGLRFSNLAESKLDTKNEPPKNKSKQSGPMGRSKVTFNTFSTLISTLILIPTLYMSSVVYQSETSVALAKYYAYSTLENRSDFFVKYADQAISNRFTDNLNKLKLAALMLDLGMSNEGLQELDNLQKIDPRKIDTLQVLALQLRKQSNLREELIYRELISQLDPFNTKNYQELIKLNLLIGETSTAKAYLNTVKKYDPNWIELNKSFSS